MVYPFAYRSRGSLELDTNLLSGGIICAVALRSCVWLALALSASACHTRTHVSSMRGNVMRIYVIHLPMHAALARTSSVRPASACPWGSIWVRWSEGSKGPENSSALPLLLNVGPIVWPIAFAGGVYRDGTRSVRYEGKKSLRSTKHQ